MLPRGCLGYPRLEDRPRARGTRGGPAALHGEGRDALRGTTEARAGRRFADGAAPSFPGGANLVLQTARSEPLWCFIVRSCSEGQRQRAAGAHALFPGSPSPPSPSLLETSSGEKGAGTSFGAERRNCGLELAGGHRSHGAYCPVPAPRQDAPAMAAGDGGAPGARQSPAPRAGAGPTGCSCPNLINKRSRLGSSVSPVYRAANSSEAKSPFSVSLAANYSFPVRQSVLNLAVRGLLKEIMQQCPLSGSLRNNILRDRRKLMRKCGVYKPLSLPMLEGLTINTWSITGSFSKDFF